jgi:hypothetical protein
MGKSKGKVFLFFVVRYIATEASVLKIMVVRVLLISLIQVVLLLAVGAPGLPTRILFPRQQRLRKPSEARAKWWICGVAFHQRHALVQLEG